MVKMNKSTFLMFLVAIVLLAPLCRKAKGDATEEDFINLYDTLLTNYKRHVRPIANQSEAVNVKFTFALLAIEEINDIKQHLKVLGVVFLEWTDKNLVWNSSEYGGLDRLYLDENKIWAPKVGTRHSPFNDVPLFTLPTIHTVLSSGVVVYESEGAINTICGLDMTYFPFDSHDCRVRFALSDSSIKDVVFGGSMVEKSPAFIEDEEWVVVGMSVNEKNVGRDGMQYSTVEITIELKRRPVYYVLNVVLPTVVLGILSLVTFIVPAESGERLSYTLTTLLSLFVYIPYIGGLIPTSSIHIPVVLRYLISLFLMNVMCVVMSAVIVAIRWSDVEEGNDVEKNILIFGVSFTIKKRRGQPSSIRLQNYSRKGTCFSKNCRVEDVTRKEDSAGKGNNQSSHPLGIGEFLIRNELRSKQPEANAEKQSDAKAEKHIDLCTCLTTEGKQVDPDVKAISDLVSRYSFLLLLLFFFIMTAITFVQLYCKNF